MDSAGHGENTLYYGDNLDILRDYIPDESVDLVYLDPPFNSNRNYNVLFKDESGKEADAQIEVFDDTWHWGETAEQTYHELWIHGPDEVAKAMVALRSVVGSNQVMAYLVMMAARLVELHRVLKPTGSLYLHCDPTSSHYLKIILDTIFGPRNFRNEIIWKRTSSHNDARLKFAGISDTILYYARSSETHFRPQYRPHDQSYLENFYRYTDENGRRYRLGDLNSPNPRPNLVYDYKGYKPHQYGWRVSREKMEQLDVEDRLHFPKNPKGRIQQKRFLDEMQGTLVGNVWDDILPVQSQAAERLGYPTQKPLSLLERIINTSSNSGDVVLDPFCGCGTTIAAAEKLKRNWIGIDVTHLSIALLKYRLQDMFPNIEFAVIGEPQDIGAAHQLALDDRYQFQWWALSLIRAKPLGGKTGGKKGKKGADQGIDGSINFVDAANGKPSRVLVQVKSGHVKSSDIRDLRGTVERENAAMGAFVTLEEPSKPMGKEAVSAGFYHSPGWGKDYPRIQILTIEELLHGAGVKMPPRHGTFKEAQKVLPQAEKHPQFELDGHPTPL